MEPPFYSPTEFSEDEIADALMAGYEMVADAPRKLLIAHCPPYRTALDCLYSGAHAGSTSVRAFIEAHQPDVCISGHIHESAGEDQIGATHVFNPGMLAQGGYITVIDEASGLTAQRITGRDSKHYSTSPFLPPSL